MPREKYPPARSDTALPCQHDRAATGGLLRVGYGLGTPWQVEVALVYVDDLDLQLNSVALTPIALAQSVEGHAPAAAFGLAPTLAYSSSLSISPP